MSHNDAKSIHKLLGSMHLPEHQTLETLLTAFHSKFGDYNPKTLQLYKLLNDNTDIHSDDELKIRICAHQSNDTYFKLMSRLKEKVFENLLLDINIRRKGIYSTPWIKQQQLRKNLIIIDIISLRGLVEEALGLIDRSIREAEKYELYAEICQLLNSKFNLLLRQNNFKEAEQVEKDWLKYSSISEISSKSHYYFYSTAFGRGKKSDPEFYARNLEEKIRDLESYEMIKSVPIAYYYLLFMQIQLEEIRGNHRKIMELGVECLDLLSRNPQIAKKARYANSYLQLYTANIYLTDFEQAYEYIMKVMNYVNPESKNYLEVLECAFFAKFYNKAYGEAGEILDNLTIQALKVLSKEDHSFQKFNLHKGFRLFVAHEFQAASKLLLQVKETGKEDTDRNFMLRLLQIMCRIELEDFDGADAMIENLRKYADSLKKLNKIRKRNLVIQKILSRTVSEGFDFTRVAVVMQKSLAQLESDAEDYRWNYFSPELVPFHQWYMTKTKVAQVRAA